MRKPLNLKDLGKTPASVTLPETPFERGMGADASRPFPSQPPKVQDGPKREFPMNASQAPTIGGYDAKNEPPKINAKPWQIAVQNSRAQRAKEIGVGDITKDRTATVAETASQWMIQRQQLEQQLNPQTARIEAAQQALEALFAQRPELAEQAKIMFPNEAQLGVAGLAALLQPGRAFESLAKPFQFQQQEQARQQQLNNQQFASDREEWGMMYQRAVGDLNSEYKMEETRLDNVGKSIQSFDDLTADQYTQDQLTLRNRESIQGRYTVQELKGAQDWAKEVMRQTAMTDRELLKSPEQMAMRLQQGLVQAGYSQEAARDIAWAEVNSPYYKNLQVQENIRQSVEMFPVKMQQAVLNLAKTEADIRAIDARRDYTLAQANQLGETHALNVLKYALDVEKFNSNQSQNAKEYDLKSAEALFTTQQARAKVLSDQFKAAQANSLAKKGTPEYEAAYANEQQIQIELARTNQDILAAAKAIEAITGKAPAGGPISDMVNRAIGGAAASGGGFRAEPQWPVAGGRISSGFGPRRAPTRGASTDHRGLDIAVARGTPIKPLWAGEVVRTGYQATGGGHYVVIRHPNGYETKYMHMQAASPLKVGDRVGNSTVIGKVGKTGTATGFHLHVEVLRNGQHIDPLTVLPRR